MVHLLTKVYTQISGQHISVLLVSVTLNIYRIKQLEHLSYHINALIDKFWSSSNACPMTNIYCVNSLQNIPKVEVNMMTEIVTRPVPNVLENPPIILSSFSQKNCLLVFLIPIQYLLFLNYSFFLYYCRLLLETMETVPTSCQLKMKHIMIIIIIIIII